MEAAVEGPAELILFAANRRVVVFPGQNQVVRQKIELPFRVFFPAVDTARELFQVCHASDAVGVFFAAVACKG